MVGLVIIIGIVLIYIIFIISLINTKPRFNKESAHNQSGITLAKYSASKRSLPPFVYKNIQIRSFEIVGMFYNIGEDKTFIGCFTGYAECEYNEYDYYAVGIYNKESIQLGHVPRRNMWLYNSIEHYHSRKVFCWGSLDYDTRMNKWYGTVFIPVGFGYRSILKIEKFLSLDEATNKLSSKSNINVKDYFQMLENLNEMLKLKEGLNNTIYLPHSHLNPIIIKLSKILEDSKMWEKLVDLEQYSIIITGLNIRYQNSISKRIEKAKYILASEDSESKKTAMPSTDVSRTKEEISRNETINKLVYEKSEWETPRAYWSSVQLPGYRYSEKKKAWWKQKPY